MHMINVNQGAGQPAALAENLGIRDASFRMWTSVSKAPVPGKGVFFHEHIDLKDPEGDRLTDHLVEAYDRVRPRERKRGRDALRLRLRRLAANALRAHFYSDLPDVLYQRGGNPLAYRDKPNWMRFGALADVIDALSEAGLVQGVIGKKMPINSATPSAVASYRATHILTEIALECGVAKGSIHQPIPTSDLVRLYAPKPKGRFSPVAGRYIQDRPTERIGFSPTDETQEWVAKLLEINSFYRQQSIDLAYAAFDGTAKLAEGAAAASMEQASYCAPDRLSIELYRVFNEGNPADPKFDQGGRLNGGWWMYIPSALRPSITINGRPTVELDYSGCHPRMLYHLRGLDPAGDLYTIPEVAAYEADKGVEQGRYRAAIKWLFQILLNGRGRPELVPQPEWLVLPPGIPFKELVGCIKAHHHSIADEFETGVGLRLMRLESDIALDIVSTATSEGWTALPIHDSFIAERMNQGRLKSLMIDCYQRKLGQRPSIKVS